MAVFLQMPALAQPALSMGTPTPGPLFQHPGCWELSLPASHAALLVGLRTSFSWHPAP